MTTYEIDQIFGGTPCVCGDFEEWHPRCYTGKSQAEIDALYRKVYRKARTELKRRAAIVADALIAALEKQ